MRPSHIRVHMRLVSQKTPGGFAATSITQPAKTFTVHFTELNVPLFLCSYTWPII